MEEKGFALIALSIVDGIGRRMRQVDIVKGRGQEWIFSVAGKWTNNTTSKTCSITYFVHYFYLTLCMQAANVNHNFCFWL